MSGHLHTTADFWFRLHERIERRKLIPYIITEYAIAEFLCGNLCIEFPNMLYYPTVFLLRLWRLYISQQFLPLRRGLEPWFEGWYEFLSFLLFIYLSLLNMMLRQFLPSLHP